MSNDEEFAVGCYRASLEDVGTPGLDQRILAAARRRVVQRRTLRLSCGALVAVGILIGGIRTASHHDGARMPTPSPDVTDYGVIEGTTRSYLLQVELPAYSGPGLNEGRE